MSKESHLRQVLDCGIVAVVRSPDSQQLVEVARALAEGGVTVVEITMTVPNALEVLRQVRGQMGDRVLLGAGTVLDPETARAVEGLVERWRAEAAGGGAVVWVSHDRGQARRVADRRLRVRDGGLEGEE